MKKYINLRNKNKCNNTDNTNKLDNNVFKLFYISFVILTLIILSSKFSYFVMTSLFVFTYIKAENILKILLKIIKG